MNILNLYCGIGGNRKYWDKEHTGEEHEIVAVELNPQIAAIYQDFFPNDKVIVADAHQYLLEHFKEYDFIWSSPPCPTHSRLNNSFKGEGNWCGEIRYPDIKLYEEILLLKHFFKGKYCVENVISYYEPLITSKELASHYFWANFHIGDIPSSGSRRHYDSLGKLGELKGFNIDSYKIENKRKILRNCVVPSVGLHILKESQRDIQGDLFRTPVK